MLSFEEDDKVSVLKLKETARKLSVSVIKSDFSSISKSHASEAIDKKEVHREIKRQKSVKFAENTSNSHKKTVFKDHRAAGLGKEVIHEVEKEKKVTVDLVVSNYPIESKNLVELISKILQEIRLLNVFN